MVKVKIPAVFQKTTGGVAAVEAQAATVGESVKEIVKQHPNLQKMLYDKDGQLASFILVFVNGKSVQKDDRTSFPLKDGDEVQLMMTIGGG